MIQSSVSFLASHCSSHPWDSLRCSWRENAFPKHFSLRTAPCLGSSGSLCIHQYYVDGVLVIEPIQRAAVIGNLLVLGIQHIEQGLHRLTGDTVAELGVMMGKIEEMFQR